MRFVILAVLCMASTCSHAVDLVLRPCKSGNLETTQEFSPKMAFSHFGPIRQTIAEFGYVRTDCMSAAEGRWQWEGTLSNVNEEHRGNSQQALVGAGVTWPVLVAEDDKSWSMDATPIVRLGYERTPDSRASIADLGLTLVSTRQISRTKFGTADAIFVGTFQADINNRKYGYDAFTAAGRSSRGSSFMAQAGIDKLLGNISQYRWRTSLAGQHFQSDQNSTNIGSLIVSVRPIIDEYGEYPWAIEAWVSRGSGSYRSVLISLTWREISRH